MIVEIRDVGMHVNFSGMPPFNTPAIVNIKTQILPRFINQIIQCGCIDFTVSNSPIENKKEIVDTSVDFYAKNKITSDEEVSKLNDKLNSIELLLGDLLNKESTVIQTIVSNETSNKKIQKNKEKDDEVMFIPSLKSDETSIVSSNLNQASTSDTSTMVDMQSAIDALSNI